jgi:hypothetical protein
MAQTLVIVIAWHRLISPSKKGRNATQDGKGKQPLTCKLQPNKTIHDKKKSDQTSTPPSPRSSAPRWKVMWWRSKRFCGSPHSTCAIWRGWPSCWRSVTPRWFLDTTFVPANHHSMDHESTVGAVRHWKWAWWSNRNQVSWLSMQLKRRCPGTPAAGSRGRMVCLLPRPWRWKCSKVQKPQCSTNQVNKWHVFLERFFHIYVHHMCW